MFACWHTHDVCMLAYSLCLYVRIPTMYVCMYVCMHVCMHVCSYLLTVEVYSAIDDAWQNDAWQDDAWQAPDGLCAGVHQHLHLCVRRIERPHPLIKGQDVVLVHVGLVEVFSHLPSYIRHTYTRQRAASLCAWEACNSYSITAWVYPLYLVIWKLYLIRPVSEIWFEIRLSYIHNMSDKKSFTYRVVFKKRDKGDICDLGVGSQRSSTRHLQVRTCQRHLVTVSQWTFSKKILNLRYKITEHSVNISVKWYDSYHYYNTAPVPRSAGRVTHGTPCEPATI